MVYEPCRSDWRCISMFLQKVSFSCIGRGSAITCTFEVQGRVGSARSPRRRITEKGGKRQV